VRVGKCAEGCVRPHNNTAPVRALRGPSPSSDRTSAPTPPLRRRTGSPTWKTIVKWSAAPMLSFSTPREQQVTAPATCARLDDRLPDREKTARRRFGFPAISLARVVSDLQPHQLSGKEILLHDKTHDDTKMYCRSPMFSKYCTTVFTYERISNPYQMVILF